MEERDISRYSTTYQSLRSYRVVPFCHMGGATLAAPRDQHLIIFGVKGAFPLLKILRISNKKIIVFQE